MPRILIFSPYALWSIHTVYEATIARACAARGARIEYLLCDGMLQECDQHWDSKDSSGRPVDLCQRCQAAARTDAYRTEFPYLWLSSLVDIPQRTAAFAWAQGLSPAQFRTAKLNGLPLGEWVLSSVVSYFRKYPPSLDDPRVVQVYRGFLQSAALVACGLEKYLDANAVDAALLFNGRQSITRVAFEVFRKRGIRVLTHERAEYERGHINVKPNAHCMSPEPFKQFWRQRAETPLNREELDRTLQWLVRRRYGANLAWIPFNNPSLRHSSIRKRLGLPPEGQLWALFTSSMDEVAADPVMKGPYDSQLTWMQEVVNWAKLRDDVQLVIKVHPNLGGNSYIGKAVDELRIYQRMKQELPANVRIVMPEEQLSAYELAEEADIGLTFGSIMGLEMAMMGKPVLLASRALYENGSQILTVRSKDELASLLERCLRTKPGKEIRREAFRLAYAYIFLFELPFPAVKMLDLYQAEPNYGNISEVAGDSSLKRICDFLINGEELFGDGAGSERDRTTADEDVFFAELAKSPEYLTSKHYERWLILRSFGRATRQLLHYLPFGSDLARLGRNKWNTLLTRIERSAMQNQS